MQQFFDFPINPKYSFANFVVCTGNRTAFQFAGKLVNGADTENLLYIHGPEGAGKTHLLAALSLRLGELASGAGAVPCFSFKDVDQLYGGEYPAEAASKLFDRFRDAPALLIDDVHLMPDVQSLRVELWQVFNDFYSAGKKIVMTGLYPPKELPHIDEHLVSRLLWGLVVRIDVSDDDSRRMIMKKLAEDRQILLPADVIDYLLLHVRRDIPSLAAALEVIRRRSLAEKRKISLRLAREALDAGV